MDHQLEDGNFSIVHRSEIPKDETIFPVVWQMRRKQVIKIREIKKHKARLNFDGSRIRAGSIVGLHKTGLGNGGSK